MKAKKLLPLSLLAAVVFVVNVNAQDTRPTPEEIRKMTTQEIMNLQVDTVIEQGGLTVTATPSQAGNNLLLQVNGNIIRTAEPYKWIGTHGDVTTLMAQNMEGLYRLIDLEGKVLITGDYVGMSNFSSLTIIAYKADGSRDLYDRATMQIRPKDAMQLTVVEQGDIQTMQNYDARLKAGQPLPQLPRFMIRIVAQANREAEAREKAEAVARRQAYLDAMGFKNVKMDNGDVYVEIQGKRIEANNILFFTNYEDPFCFFITTDKQEQHFLRANTQTGEWVILTQVKINDKTDEFTLKTIPYKRTALSKDNPVSINWRRDNIIAIGIQGRGSHEYSFDYATGKFEKVN